MFQVDAFTKEVFGGNSAAVCVLGGNFHVVLKNPRQDDFNSGCFQKEGWISSKIMLNVAMENNLAETAFCIKDSARKGIINY